MIFEVALYYYLDVAIVNSGFNTVMHCRQPESYIIDIEIPESGVFSIDNFDRRSLFAVTATVDNEEVPLSEDELIKCHKRSLVV